MARTIPHRTPPPFTGRSLLRVRLFGRILIEAGRRHVQVAIPNRTLPTLAFLLLHRAEALARNRLATLLWPDEGEASARTRLRSNLHALVHALPPLERGSWLSRDAETVQWNPVAPVWLDVAEFEALVRDPHGLEDAVSLYSGDLAQDLQDEWIVRERDRLRQSLAEALEALVGKCREQRAFSEAFAHARRLLTIDPWREDVVRRIISMRYESGDRAGGLAEFDAFARRLREEMGTDPMPETIALRDRLERGAALGELPAIPLEARGTRPRESEMLPFIGRREEFAALLECWTRAARGRGGTVFIGGEAGIGKTRLTSELERHVENSGGRVLRGSTSSPETAPYQAFVEALRSALPLLAKADLPSVWFAALGTLLPELREHRPGANPLPGLDSGRERQRLFEGIVRALLALTGPRPVLLILEDLHWANEATLAALHFVARRMALAPLLIVATHRDEETTRAHPLRRLRRELQAQGLAQHVTPLPLGVDDVGALALRLPALHEREASIALLHARSGGNPLFLTHLVQSLLDGDLETFPQPLRSFFTTRLERLPERSRTLAEIAALIGRQFSIEILQDVTGWTEGEVLAALDELIERRLVREIGLVRRFEYHFTHHLVQAAIAETIPASVAARRHRQIAIVLEKLHPEADAEASADLALHHELAGDFDAAVSRYLDAAERAVALGAHDEALAHLTRGLGLQYARAQRVPLLLLRESLLGRRGDRVQQRADLDELSGIAAAESDESLACDVLCRRAEYTAAIGARDEQGAVLAELRLRTRRLPKWAAALFYAETKYFERLGLFDEAKAAAERAIAAYREIGETGCQVEMFCILARIQAHREAPAESERLLEAAAHLVDSPVSACLVLEERTHLAVMHDDREQREELCRQLAELCRSVGDRNGEALALERIAIAMLLDDRFGEAIAAFDEAMTIASEIDDRRRAATIMVNRAHLDMILGSFAEAAAAIDQSLTIYETRREVFNTLMCLNNRSAIATLMGDGEQGRALALTALEGASSHRSVLYEALAFENLAEAERECGDVRAAIAAMEASLARRRSIGSLVSIAHGTALLAIWYLTIGDLQSARERIEEMLLSEGTIGVGSPWPQFCFWVAARVFRSLAEPQRARRFLDRAYAMTMAKANKCPDARRRASFLGLEWHRNLIAAHEQDVWPDEHLPPSTSVNHHPQEALVRR